MKNLRLVSIADRYRSNTHDVADDFYNPCLQQAVRYDRAVGYFTSGSLAIASQGITELEASQGQIRLIASPHLNATDVRAIEKGYEYRKVVQGAVTRELEDLEGLPDSDLVRLGALGRLIAKGQLDIKIAIVKSKGGIGIYHEKIGTITDALGNQLAFTGSLNETASAMLDNFESIQVFCSWEDGDVRRVRSIQQDFDQLWEEKTHGLQILEFPEAARRKLIEIGQGASKGTGTNKLETSSSGWLSLPREINLHGYQKKAVEQWLAAEGRGIYQMATGTGKTITALAAGDQLGRQLRAAGSPLVTVVIVPLLGVADQWTDELRRFGVTPIQCRDSWQVWEPELLDGLAALGGDDQARHLAIVVTNATLASERFQNILSSIEWPLFAIGDEMHNLGASRLLRCLPGNATFRLGLSATPVRHLDPDGTDALVDFFGEVCIDLGIKEAIEMGSLTPYRYFPILVPLTEDEADFYAELTSEISRLYARGEAGGDVEERMSQLLGKRAKVLGHAEGKIAALATQLSKRRNSTHQLIYCAEGARPTRQGVSEVRQIDEVTALAGSVLAIPTHPYTATENAATRREVLRSFANGQEIRVLTSMRCLDEGVDLPDARIAYMLASSTNPRQFIQRRGRVLRRTDGKTRADIVDFVAVPPGTPELRKVERRLFRRELERCIEFARHAENQGFALAELRDLREQYELMDV